ncbi:MAG: AtaL-like protein [Myxococcota bacterium]
MNASSEVLWAMLRDKIRRPDKYVPGVVSVEVLSEFGGDSIEREMTVQAGDKQKAVREIITADPVTMTVLFKLKDDPSYTGYVLNTIFDESGVVELEYTLHWTPKQLGEEPAGPDMAAAIKNAVLHTKAMAEEGE